MSAYASATQFCWGNRETLSALFFFFIPLFFSDLASKRAAPCYSTCIQPFVPKICEQRFAQASNELYGCILNPTHLDKKKNSTGDLTVLVHRNVRQTSYFSQESCRNSLFSSRSFSSLIFFCSAQRTMMSYGMLLSLYLFRILSFHLRYESAGEAHTHS